MSSTVEHSVKVGRCQVLNWSQFDRWVPIDHGLTSNELDTGWKWVPMHELVRQIDGREAIDEKCNYDLAGIRLDGHGIYHRESVLGGETSATYLSQLRPGAFIYGRLFAWRGAFASVKEEHAGLWCSNEFPQFEIDSSQIDADYLVRFMLHPSTLERVGKSSVGTAAMSRNRFKEVEFLNLVVPLPPLATQRSIVAHWQAGMQQAAALEAKAKKLVEEAQAGFVEALGIKAATMPRAKDRAFAVDWEDLSSWHGGSNLKRLTMGDVHHGRYPVIRGNDCLLSISHGCSASPVTTPTGLEVLPISAVTKGFLDLSKRKNIPDRSALRDAYSLRTGDVLMCRTNGTLAYVGMSALVEKDHPDLIFPDKVIRVRPKPDLRPDYLWLLLQTPPLRAQVGAAARTAVGNYAIGGKDIWSFEFPVPPVEVQAKLTKQVLTARQGSEKLRGEADELRRKTKEEVEGMVMGKNQVMT